MKKRILCLVLVLLMLVGIVPAHAVEAGDADYSTLPGALSARPWVFQNDLPTPMGMDTLVVTPPSDSGDPCGCCDSCTGVEGCRCVCGSCDFCLPEIPSLTHPTGVEVYAESLPEGVTLEVSKVGADTLLDKSQIPAPEPVFGLDITLRNADNTEHQPGGALVKVPVTAPVGTKIGLIHEHNGVITFMGVTQVQADGTVVFETNGFSEFAGFIVEFHYEGATLTVTGKSSVLLSELFDALDIREDITQVSEVTFSAPDVVAVDKTENDWQLTSLAAFDTEESLLVVFSDGHFISISVVDDENSETLNEDGASVTRSIFHDQRTAAYPSYGHYTEWGGMYKADWYLYDGSTLISESHSPAWRVAIGVQFVVTSDYYWYTVECNRSMEYNTDTETNMRFGAIVGKPVVTYYRHSNLIFSDNSYCTVRQKSKTAIVGDVESRRVRIFADGTQIMDQYFNFPDRDGDSMDAGDLIVSDLKSPYYKSSVSIENGYYRVDLTSRYNLSGSVNAGKGTASPSSQYIDYNKSGNIVFTANTGYLIDYITVNGTKTDITNTASYTYTASGVTANQTVIAYATPITYTINYYPGNGSGSMASQSVQFDGQTAICANGFIAPTGYQFAGWTTKTDYTDDGYGWTGWSGKWTYVDGQRGINNKMLNLYARWSKRTFTVNYHGNGGTGNMTSQSVVYGDTIQIKNNEFTAPQGKRFAGWAVSAKGTAGEYGWSGADKTGWSGTWSYDNGQYGIANDTLNLYAIWEDIGYTVTWKNWDGTVLETEAVTYNGSATYDGTTPTKPDADGYAFTFSGWDKGSNGTISNITADTEVTAQYSTTAISYTATFHYNGGDAGEATQKYTIASGLTLPRLTKTGYTGKWKVTSAAGNWVNGAEYAPGSTIAEKYGNVTFTAQWQEQYRYVLKFDANGGNGTPGTITVDWCNSKENKFTWTGVPTREGYTFLGWGESADSKINVAGGDYNTYTVNGKEAETVEKTLYAIWQRDTGDLKLTFNGNGSTPAIVNVKGQGLDITVVLTKAETIIKDLPTGSYNVTAVSGNASYTASVTSTTTPSVRTDQTTTVNVSVSSRGLNWLTAFFRVKNQYR